VVRTSKKDPKPKNSLAFPFFFSPVNPSRRGWRKTLTSEKPTGFVSQRGGIFWRKRHKLRGGKLGEVKSEREMTVELRWGEKRKKQEDLENSNFTQRRFRREPRFNEK